MQYKDSGVDIEKLSSIKNKIIKKIKQKIRSAGLFSSGVKIDENKYLFSSIDGIGTKTKIAVMMNNYRTIGFDIVNHCVNDMISSGILPISFLDYIAFSEMEEKAVADVIESVYNACEENGILLVGGETAQMPAVYNKGDFDLVGVINGIGEEKDIIKRENIKRGDILWGLKSSGLHTNGYSLARKVLFEEKFLSPNYKVNGENLGEILLKPHKSYLTEFKKVKTKIKGIVHITGGGFPDNIKRVLPENLSFNLYKNSWDIPDIFLLIQKLGSIEKEEMLKTLNMGIGMIFISSPDEKLNKIIDAIKIGEVV